MGKSIHLLTERERLLLGRAQAKVYASVDGGKDLSIHFYFPRDLSDDASRPVFLFFNGGAWDRGSVVQFAPHALHFVERGAVCGLVEYRNRASHPGVSPEDALTDGRAAIRFVREHSDRLHVDPSRLVAFGASAGGNLAGNAANADEPSRPNAVVMYSPIIDIEKGAYGYDAFVDNAEARKASLSRHIVAGMPPMLIIHGTADRLVPIKGVQEFSKRVGKKKNSCDFVEFEGRDQNFFNLNYDPASYEIALSTTAEFLDRHRILVKSEDDEDTQVISWRERDY
tara:strand:+ start:2825 stop:3673 length:849 start_codon:yes stop_codon:yes gene_type:complete